MAEKKKPQNKSEKKSTSTKEKINWNEKPAMVDIVFNGKTVNTRKENAELLVKAGKAKLA